MRAVAALAIGGWLLAACGGGGGSPDGGTITVPPAQLCVRDDCATRTVLATIPDAENILFATDGRLFVSGGTNVYEIRRNGSDYSATPLFEGSANFTGLAIRAGTLYANSFDGQLYAAALSAAPQLAPIHDLGLAAPNGLVDGPDGELYLVNGPLATNALPDPKIVRVRLNPADPLEVIEQVDWYTGTLLGPNGLQRQDRRLYVSNTGLGGLGEIQAVDIAADGSAVGAGTVARFDHIPDDFSLAGDHFLVSWFADGQVALLGPDGAERQSTGLQGLSFPSQVRVGRPPLFAPDEILVTEKGLIGDNDSAIGNVLSVLRPNR